MAITTSIIPEAATSLAVALIASSQAPLLLLADDLTVIGASATFCTAFGVDPLTVNGTKLAELGSGEWKMPQLESLLRATFAGAAAIDAYEMEFVREGQKPATLVLNAHKLDYFDGEEARIILAVTDITSARLAEKLKDDLAKRNEILLQELEQRVANSLQTIASVLVQNADRVQSEETRTHLHDAHQRVMSIATLQKQLDLRSSDKEELDRYLEELCASMGVSMIDDPDRVAIASTADVTATSANVSVSLGLIVTELVINALEHAFPGRNPTGSIRGAPVLRSAVRAGLIAGTVFIALEMILVWLAISLNPVAPPLVIAAIVMGPEVLPSPGVLPGSDIIAIMAAILVHFVLSVALALIFRFIAGALKLQGWTLLAGGAGFGLLIYAVNVYGLTVVFPWLAMVRNWISIVAHVIFGLVMATALMPRTKVTVASSAA